MHKRLLEILVVLTTLFLSRDVLADNFLIDFEGTGNNVPTADYYDGNGGPSWGITFSASATSCIDSDAGGSCNIGGEPTPDTVIYWLSGGGITVDVASGFSDGFSLFYTSPFGTIDIEVYDGPGGTGNLLGSITLPASPDNGAPDPTGSYSPFSPGGLSFSGDASSVVILGLDNNAAVDNLTFGRDVPVASLAGCNNGFAEGDEMCDGADLAPGFDVCPGGYQGTPICNNDPAHPSGNATCTLDAVPEGCTDVDECTLGTDNCDANAACTNTQGSFSCACNQGFTGDGVTCVDDDECTLGTDNCDLNATCTNTPGAFTCACNTGYSGDGVTCADVDECALATDNCDVNATCTNTPGAFTCACDTGYTGDGVTCADVDECADGTDDCDMNATCTNTVGSFTCACDTGYAGDGLTCIDIDECADGTDDCDVNAMCTNTPGSFACDCNTGFTGDGLTCADVDECADGTDDCDPDATCTNVDGGFQCECPEGTTGDGTACVATCGDGIVRLDEACDDGNADSGDGCSSACEVEEGFTCADDEPSTCSEDELPVDASPTAASDSGCSCRVGAERRGGIGGLPLLLLGALLFIGRRRRARSPADGLRRSQ